MWGAAEEACKGNHPPLPPGHLCVWCLPPATSTTAIHTVKPSATVSYRTKKPSGCGHAAKSPHDAAFRDAGAHRLLGICEMSQQMPPRPRRQGDRPHRAVGRNE